jgi:hypothetical protein
MYKILLAVAVFGLTACAGEVKTEEASVENTVVDSVVVDSAVTDTVTQ